MATKVLAFLITGRDELSGVVQRSGKNVEKSSGGMVGAIGKAQLAYVALGGVIAGVFGKAVSDARNLNLTPLKVAAQDAHIQWSALAPAVANAGKTFANLGFTQGQVNTALTKLITSTQNQHTALNALNTAADLARYKHIDLASASDTLARAAAGNTRALTQLGISTAMLPKHFKTTGDAAWRTQVILDLMNQRIGGQAQAYATTFGGKMDVLKAKFTNLSAALGMILIPWLSKLMTSLINLMNWFQSLPSPIQRTVGVLLAVAATAVPIGIAVVKIKAGFMALKAAVTAFGIASKLAALGNPWVLLAMTIAVVALLIITHWKTVSHWASVCWNAIYGAVKFVWDWIRTHWPLLLAIMTGPIGIATLAIIRNWNAIKNGCSQALSTVVGFFRALPGWILHALGNLGGLLLQAGKDVIAGLWNGMKWYWDNGPFGWLKSLAGIISKIKGPISLDAQLLIPHGKAIMGGFLKGLTKGWGGITGFLGGVASKVGKFFGGLFGGGGGSSWDGLILQVLGLLGQSPSWLGVVRSRMMQESGGNPKAINLWDSNAKAGHPSMGLMQTIQATFDAFAGPFRGLGIWNPLANMYAGLNYALHRYGSLAALSQPGGYALGTANARRGWAWVGENGPELMHFDGGEQVGPIGGRRSGGVVVNVYVSGHALASKQEIGRTVADALGEFKRKGGRLP